MSTAESKIKNELSQLCNKLVTEVEDTIQCPVCLELKSDVIQCTVGHHVCEACRKNLNSCPTCKSPFTGTKSFVIEEVTKMISNLKLTLCAFENDSPGADCIKEYRTFIKTLFERMSDFLNKESGTMMHIQRYLQNHDDRDEPELRRRIDMSVNDMKSITEYMNKSVATLIDLKTRSIC